MADIMTEPSQTAEQTDPLLHEAVAFLIVDMIWADGEVNARELDHARSSMARCRLFADSSIEDDKALIKRMEAASQEDRVGNRDHYSAILRESPWRFSALAIMADIMTADGVMDQREINVLLKAAEVQGVSEAEIMTIIENIGTDDLEDLITGDNLEALEGMLPVGGTGRLPSA